MKVMIHDLDEGTAFAPGKSDKDLAIIHANNQYAPCRGCFQCWLKNAGFCVMKDSLQHIGALIGQSDPLIIISRCCYGDTAVLSKPSWIVRLGIPSRFSLGVAVKPTTSAATHAESCCVFIFMGNARNLNRRQPKRWSSAIV